MIQDKEWRYPSVGRFGLSLALSLALHVALFALFPYPTGGRVGTELNSAVYVRMTSASAGAPESSAVQNGRPVQSGRSDAPSDLSPETPLPALAAPGPRETAVSENAGTVGLSAVPVGTPGTDASAGLSAEDRAAALLLARVEAALRYPEPARLRGVEGVTRVRIQLDSGGSLKSLRVVQSSGSRLLDTATREAVEASLPLDNPSGRPLAFELAVRFARKTKTAAP